jgi:hypothetical protein
MTKDDLYSTDFSPDLLKEAAEVIKFQNGLPKDDKEIERWARLLAIQVWRADD